MNNLDTQQYQLMQEYIREFEKGKLKIDKLVNGLNALIESLDTADQEWKDRFQSEWWDLEQVYAVSLDRGETTLSRESQNLVNETIDNMKSLLKKIQ